VRGVQRIRAGLITRIDAELLDSVIGAALLIIEQRCFVDDGRSVDSSETRCSGAKYDILTGLGQ